MTVSGRFDREAGPGPASQDGVTQTPFDSEWLFGLHDAGGERLMLDSGKPGWSIFVHSIGHDPADQGGFDFRSYSSQGLGVICRLNNGFFPAGTIPHSSQYGDFAARCANFVAASPGCRIWIIGNEPNYAVERPQGSHGTSRPGRSDRKPTPRASQAENSAVKSTTGTQATALSRVTETFIVGLQALGVWPFGTPSGDGANVAQRAVPEKERRLSGGGGASAGDPYFHGLPQRFSALYEGMDAPSGTVAPEQFERLVSGGQAITPAMYARCYGLCRDAIRRVPGHGNDRVLVCAIAPWNNQTAYPGNERGDWVAYLSDILSLLGAENCDGFALHTYSHTADPGLIKSEARMDPPFQDRRYNFRAYQDFLGSVPPEMRHLPVYITETDQNVPWLDDNIGWVQSAYAEIDRWNRQPEAQRIRSLVLYRWSKVDKWHIDGKQGVIEDFREALKRPFRWDHSPPEPLELSVGDKVQVRDIVNMRRTPGYIGKPADDVLAELPYDSVATVVDSRHQVSDGLVWWRVSTELTDRGRVTGWLAQFTPAGAALLVKVGDGRNDGDDGDGRPPPDGSIGVGDRVQALDYLRMRRTPGYQFKPETDIVADLVIGEVLDVLGGPRTVDALPWWQVRRRDDNASDVVGWVAEYAPNGQRLLAVYSGGDDDGDTKPVYRFRPGDAAETLNFVRLRRSPGFMDKPESDVVADIWEGTPVTILDGPQFADGLTWWHVRTVDAQGLSQTGWMAEEAPGGIPLLGRRDDEDDVEFDVGELVVVGAVPVRVRRTPGYLDKPDNDVLGEFGANTTLNVHAPSESANGLKWWPVGGVARSGELSGWVAQSTPGGVDLVRRARKLPGTNIPDRKSGDYLAAPYDGTYGIAQLWGENVPFYSRYSYDGVSLMGHNGIDFLTPTGTPVKAVDDGVVAFTGWEPAGYGNYVILSHKWGESLYAHLDRIDVQQGQEVRQSAAIGASGNTGGSTGPHLHFTIRILPYDRKDGWGGYSDPLPYLPPTSFILPDYVLSAGAAESAEGDGETGTIEKWAPSSMADDVPGRARP